MPTQEVPCAAQPATLLQRKDRRPHAVLLDGGGTDSWGDGRVLFTDTPRATLEVFSSSWGRWRVGGSARWRRFAPLTQWQQFLAEAATLLPPSADRQVAGVVTVLSYELRHWIERLPRRHPWPRQPVLFSALYDWRYSADYRSGRAWIGAQSQPELAARVCWFEREGASGGTNRPPVARATSPQPRVTKAAYRRMINRAQEYIAAGDIYQVNLSQRFTMAGQLADGPTLFAAWCGQYPMPFAGYVDGGDWIIVSNSPECFLLVDRDRVSTFPIKGTRRMPASDAPTELLMDMFRHDPKEHAEHLMIVDLERNDLGRVCTPGSVEVAEFASVRRYPLLWHMVSEVRGQLPQGTSLGAVLGATFPGGSITGAPKIRAMEIIEELEPCSRGLYTGSVGWTDLDGASRFNLAIRSAVLTRRGLVYHAGGGIVADSDPEREYEETILKSEALFRALAPSRQNDG